MRNIVIAGAMALSFLCAGCGQAPGSNGAGPRRPELITAAEIATAQVATAYDAVQRLRPQFLSARGMATSRSTGLSVRAQLDDQPVSLEELRRVRAEDVAWIRFLSATDATIQNGTGNGAPVIQVVTRARARTAR